jgi:ABC-type ATPase with predicted acetyltransferase domain
MLITGSSGSGKSSLLRALARRGDAKVVNIAQIRPARVPCIDQFGGEIGLALDLLSRLGLAEAFTWMQLPRELSDGQRWRLRLALGIAQASHHERALLVVDEFCAILDRVTAGVVARALRRTIDRLNQRGPRLAAIIATSHDDLGAALLPDVAVRCDFGATRVQLRTVRSAAG